MACLHRRRGRDKFCLVCIDGDATKLLSCRVGGVNKPLQSLARRCVRPVQACISRTKSSNSVDIFLATLVTDSEILNSTCQSNYILGL